MTNISCSSDEREFYVFIDPENWLVRHHIQTVGSFASTPQLQSGGSELMFLPNPKFHGAISPFQSGMLANYIADYNLEINRAQRYPQYPSRLGSLFLLNSKQEAKTYKAAHPCHVKSRILKKCVTESKYLFSTHDAAWVDFLRIQHMLDHQTVHDLTSSYWEGDKAQEGVATSMGKPWIPKSVQEVLFVGRVNFPDRDLTKCEL